MTAYVWQADNLLAATRSLEATWQGDFTASSTRIITDTRKITAGDVFLAIRGDNFDAHDFIQTAKEAGAVAAIVSRAVDADIPQLIVNDTKLALGLLGKYRRDAHTDLTVVALTGSSGKTTTKEMIGAILNQIAPTLMTRGNLNNDLGVPMMLLELDDEQRFAVMELGANHLGEIAYTADMVSPTVACVLNIGTAHLGEFGGRDNIAKAKSEIYTALKSDGVALLPLADDYYEMLTDAAAEHTELLLSFGERPVPLKDAHLSAEDEQMLSAEGVSEVLVMGDLFADEVVCHATYCTFDLHANLDDGVESVSVHLPFIGEHNVSNALAAAATCFALGVSLELIAKGLAAAVAPKGRLTRMTHGEHILIDDTYNANPTSMLAAARVLEKEAGVRVLVLGDVFELGEAADAEHAKLGTDLADVALEHVLTLGEHMQHTTDALNAQIAGRSVHFNDKISLLAALNDILAKANTTVLFKGSRGMAMETLIADLTKNTNNKG